MTGAQALNGIVPAYVGGVFKLMTHLDLLNITYRGMGGKLANLGGIMMPGSPADFGKFVTGETDKWAKVIHEAHIKLTD